MLVYLLEWLIYELLWTFYLIFLFTFSCKNQSESEHSFICSLLLSFLKKENLLFFGSEDWLVLRRHAWTFNQFCGCYHLGIFYFKIFLTIDHMHLRISHISDVAIEYDSIWIIETWVYVYSWLFQVLADNLIEQLPINVGKLQYLKVMTLDANRITVLPDECNFSSLRECHVDYVV